MPNEAAQKLTARQERAIAALLSQPSIATAARAARVGEATLWRWLQLEPFVAAYAAARRTAVSAATARLQQASARAVDALEEVMGDGHAPPAARVSAARTVLEMTARLVEIEDLGERLARVERLLESGEGRS